MLKIPQDVSKNIIKVLSPILSQSRVEKMREVANLRRDNVRVVLENISDPHNADACLRTIESYGYQHVNLVETTDEFQNTETTYSKWLTLTRFQRPRRCVDALRSEGFTILATTLSPSAQSIKRIDLTGRKIAVVFGNEHRGVSRSMEGKVDGHVILPMRGFAQSFNVSVAVASTLMYLNSGPWHECPSTVVNPIRDITPYYGKPLGVGGEDDATSLGELTIGASGETKIDRLRKMKAELQAKQAARKASTASVEATAPESTKTTAESAPVDPPPVTGPLRFFQSDSLTAPVLHPGTLSAQDRDELLARWLIRSHKESVQILRRAGIDIDEIFDQEPPC